MNIIEHLQRLDTLIIEHTRPPVTPVLRRELSIAIEQCEAYQAASDKQDQTLATQAETIERLMKDNSALDVKFKKLDQAVSDSLHQQEDDCRRAIQSRMLNHNV